MLCKMKKDMQGKEFISALSLSFIQEWTWGDWLGVKDFGTITNMAAKCICTIVVFVSYQSLNLCVIPILFLWWWYMRRLMQSSKGEDRDERWRKLASLEQTWRNDMGRLGRIGSSDCLLCPRCPQTGYRLHYTSRGLTIGTWIEESYSDDYDDAGGGNEGFVYDLAWKL